ncbi:MAG: pantothenate kinase [Spirulinaceae cyanobacterium]
MINDKCLALAIGNSRLHWALFKDNALHQTWHTPHLQKAVEKNQLPEELSTLPLYIASVVPSQTALWQNYQRKKLLTLKDVPLSGMYPTLGLDRALALWGAGCVYGFPVLVIDGGTALTFTGANPQGEILGGAILPGLGLQLKALQQQTPGLPQIQLPKQVPARWALETKEAIASGITRVLTAGIYDFIQDWQRKFPHSQIVFTGGDGELLLTYLKAQFPVLKENLLVDSQLIFLGIRSIAIN